MNYRHAFHAGNFADVVKHAVLVRILVHLRRKPASFRIIDTHAGAGRTTSPGRKRSAAANGAMESAGWWRRRLPIARVRSLLRISMRSPLAILPAA
jgi:hypothetical protein